MHKYIDEDKLTYGQRNKGEIHFLNTGKVAAVTACVGKLALDGSLRTLINDYLVRMKSFLDYPYM